MNSIVTKENLDNLIDNNKIEGSKPLFIFICKETSEDFQKTFDEIIASYGGEESGILLGKVDKDTDESVLTELKKYHEGEGTAILLIFKEGIKVTSFGMAELSKEKFESILQEWK